MKFLKYLLFIALGNFAMNSALADFHSVGWTNVFLPGGGQLIRGENLDAAKEATLETSTFLLGYSLSPHGSFSLDGTSIDYDNHKSAAKPLSSALFQEFGLKLHLMNTFLVYRDQNKIESADQGQGIDQRSSREMFKDPFRLEVLKSPWVYLPIIMSGAYVLIDYHSMDNQNKKPIDKLNPGSKAYLATIQLGVYPFGSAAPEETFYRGFVQNEFYYLVRSPYFSIPMSSLVFALSHQQSDWSGAFASGLYQGMLAYKNNGNLAFGNAVHFWGVVILGIEAYVLTLKRQNSHQPVALNFSFMFQ